MIFAVPSLFAKLKRYTVCTFLDRKFIVIKKLTLEKSWHCIQWLLACNLLSHVVCSFENVTDGSMQIM